MNVHVAVLGALMVFSIQKRLRCGFVVGGRHYDRKRVVGRLVAEQMVRNSMVVFVGVYGGKKRKRMAGRERVLSKSSNKIK